MLILALALAAPTSLTPAHQRDIACVVEIAILAEQQKRLGDEGQELQVAGKRWMGIVGARIVEETGQPRELIAVAMTETAKSRAGRIVVNDTGSSCIRQMQAELAIADAADAPLPKPIKPQ